MLAPDHSQRTLQTVVQWRYCHGCKRSALMRKIAGDTVWQCQWCGYHDTEPAPVQTSAQEKR